eukprot:gene56138-49238_t
MARARCWEHARIPHIGAMVPFVAANHGTMLQEQAREQGFASGEYGKEAFMAQARAAAGDAAAGWVGPSSRLTGSAAVAPSDRGAGSPTTPGAYGVMATSVEDPALGSGLGTIEIGLDGAAPALPPLPPLPDGWVEIPDPGGSGRNYYANPSTGASSW